MDIIEQLKRDLKGVNNYGFELEYLLKEYQEQGFLSDEVVDLFLEAKLNFDHIPPEYRTLEHFRVAVANRAFSFEDTSLPKEFYFDDRVLQIVQCSVMHYPAAVYAITRAQDIEHMVKALAYIERPEDLRNTSECDTLLDDAFYNLRRFVKERPEKIDFNALDALLIIKEEMIRLDIHEYSDLRKMIVEIKDSLFQQAQTLLRQKVLHQRESNQMAR